MEKNDDKCFTELFSRKDRNNNLFETGFIISICVNALLTLTGIIGNGLIIVAILRSQKLKTPSYLLIKSLAFTDVLVGLAFHPSMIVKDLFHLEKYKESPCLFLFIFNLINSYRGSLELLMSALISIDRYLAISLLNRYKIVVTRQRVLTVTLATWVLIGGSLTWLVEDTRFMTAAQARIFKAVFILSVLLITCAFYIASFIRLRNHTAQVQSNSSPAQFNVLKYKKTLKTMMAILGCFLVCQVPLFITMSMFESFMKGPHRDIFMVAHNFASTVHGLNSTINPVIYLVRFRDIRRACHQMLLDNNEVADQ